MANPPPSLNTPLPFVQSITVKPAQYPVYDVVSNPPKCYFALDNYVIWDRARQDSKGQKVVFPCALTKDANFSLTFAAEHVAVIQTLMKPLKVTATLGAAQLFAQNVEDPASLTTLAPFQIIPPKNKEESKSLPWAFQGNVTWLIEGSKADQPKYCCETAMEMYFFPPNLPEFFNVSGIPLALLRMKDFLPTWMSTKEKVNDTTTIDFPSFVVSALFNNKRLWYENWNGSSRYTTWEIGEIENIFARNQGIDCWLDLWISEMLQESPADWVFPVNCYDLAALCQAIASLGIDSKDKELRMNYMEPYGYIPETNLIGRVQKLPNPNPPNPYNKCNNPFYGDPGADTRMLTEPNAGSRTSFGNHMFLTLKDSTRFAVLDACCGPQTGTLSLKEYIAIAIDTNLPPNPNPSGTMGNITQGPGITSIITSRSLERPANPNPASPNLFQQISLALNRIGTCNEPHLASPTGESYTSVTWTLAPFPPYDDDIWTINLLAYDYSMGNLALEEFRRRKDSIRLRQDPATDESLSDSGSGSVRLWYNPANISPYVGIIEARMATTDDTGPLKRELANMISKGLPLQSQNIDCIESVTLNPANNDYSYEVGAQVEVVLKVTDIGLQNWSGSEVKSYRGHLLFMEAVQENNFVRFKFLARTVGNEVIRITVRGWYLDTFVRELKVWVMPAAAANP